MVKALLLTSLIETGLLSVVCTAFVVIYKVQTGHVWHDIPEGRHLMRFSAALSITFWLTFLSKLLTLTVPLWSTHVFDILENKIEVIYIALGVEVLVFGALLIELSNRVRLVLQGTDHD